MKMEVGMAVNIDLNEGTVPSLMLAPGLSLTGVEHYHMEPQDAGTEQYTYVSEPVHYLVPVSRNSLGQRTALVLKQTIICIEKNT